MIERYHPGLRHVRPTYSPIDGLWFTDDGVIAESLRELQAKLPDVVIEDYYPNGYGNIVKPKLRIVEAPWNQPLVLPKKLRPVTTEQLDNLQFKRVLHKRPEPKPEPKPEPDLSEVSEPDSEPEFDFKAPEPEVVTVEEKFPYLAPVVKFRKVTPHAVHAWPEELVKKLRRLAKRGLSASEIAEKMGDFTRNAIIGKCHRSKIALKRTPGVFPNDPVKKG